MDSTDLAKVKERIRRLLALAENPVNEHEAAIAANKARKLMLEYKLERMDIPSDAEEQEEIGRLNFDDDKGGRYRFKLLTGIGAVNFVDVLKFNYFRNRYQLVGTPSDVEVTLYLYRYLVREVDRLGALERGKGKGLEWLTNYRRGMVAAINARLQLEWNKDKADPNTMALIVNNRAALDAFYGPFQPKGKNWDGQKNARGEGWSEGVQAGKSIPINRAVNGAAKAEAAGRLLK